MIQVVNLKVYSRTVDGYIPHPVKAVVIKPFSVHVEYSRKWDFWRYIISHVKTGGLIWSLYTRKDALKLTNELLRIDPHWDFSDPKKIPYEICEELSNLIIRWEKKDADRATSEETYDDWAEYDKREARIARKLAKKSKKLQLARGKQ